MAIMSRSMLRTLPKPVTWALGLTIFNAVVGWVFSLAWPDLDDRGTIIVVGTVLTVLMLGGCLWLANGAKWGAIAFIVANAINALLALPGFTQGDVAFAVAGAISGLLSVAAIVLVFRPEARAFWQHRSVPAASS